MKTNDRKLAKNTQLFWEKESRANNTRKQSLDSIDYITIPLDQLPFLNNPSDDIADLQKTIQKLATRQIANFSGITNTDLKLTYGVANLDILATMDQNFTELLRTLYMWGNALYKEELIDEALLVLEYGIACKTDISKHYTLLAEIYKLKNTPEQITKLIAMVENSDSLMKSSTLKSLNEIFESCHAPV